MKISKEVEEMLKTEEGRQKLTALKLCEIAELLKNQRISITQTQSNKSPSMWEALFGHKANEW